MLNSCFLHILSHGCQWGVTTFSQFPQCPPSYTGLAVVVVTLPSSVERRELRRRYASIVRGVKKRARGVKKRTEGVKTRTKGVKNGTKGVKVKKRGVICCMCVERKRAHVCVCDVGRVVCV